MRNTKRRMTASLLALLVCCVMLAGTTFAWFTDTASNTGNRIQAGNLDVDLLRYVDIDGDGNDVNEYVSIADREVVPVDPENPWTGGIFNAGDGGNRGNGVNWEPGKTEIVYLGVQNRGSLALKYNIKLDVAIPDETEETFASQFEYAIIAGVQQPGAPVVDSWAAVKAVPGVQTGDVSLGTFVAAPNGCLDEIAATPKVENETDYFALAIHMKETAGNAYMNGVINFDVTVDATQMTAEFDSFSDQYDAAAVLKTANIVVENANISDNKVTVEVAPKTAVEIPVDIAPVDSTVTFSVKGTSEPNVTVATTQDSQSYDIALLVNGQPAPKLDADDPDAYYTVTLNIGTGRVNVEVWHNGEKLAADKVSYDSETGILTFRTKSFSPFDILWKKLDQPTTVNVADNASLLAAINAFPESESDNVVIVVADGKYENLQAEIVQTKGKMLTIKAANQGGAIFSNTMQNSSVFSVNGGSRPFDDSEKLTFDGLTFELNASDGTLNDRKICNGIYFMNGESRYVRNVNIINCSFDGTDGDAWTGCAVRSNADSSPKNIRFSNCTADSLTSLYNGYGNNSIVIDNCDISNMKGGVNFMSSAGKTLRIKDSVFDCVGEAVQTDGGTLVLENTELISTYVIGTSTDEVTSITAKGVVNLKAAASSVELIGNCTLTNENGSVDFFLINVSASKSIVTGGNLADYTFNSNFTN